MKAIFIVGAILLYWIVGYIVIECIAAIYEDSLDVGESLASGMIWPLVLSIFIVRGIGKFIFIPICKKLSVIPVAIVKLIQVACENHISNRRGRQY